MDNDTNLKHFLHVLDLYAKAKNWKLSQYADKIVNRCINLCDGHCPCDNSRGVCPCEKHEEEVLNNGHCHCTLFLKCD